MGVAILLEEAIGELVAVMERTRMVVVRVIMMVRVLLQSYARTSVMGQL
jgi:hypothetical protein